MAPLVVAGVWREQGSAGRQRLVPLGIPGAKPPSCGQNTTGCNLEGQSASGGEEQGVLRHQQPRLRLWAKSGGELFSSSQKPRL